MINFILPCIMVALAFLSGCDSVTYNQTDGNIAESHNRIADFKKSEESLSKTIPPVVVKKGLYVDTTPISLERQPDWLRNKVIIRGNNMPFVYYTGVINNAAGQNILTKFQADMRSRPLSINYIGTVKGALDLLATKSGNVYNIRKGNIIYWQSYVTRTFSIAFIPGSANYEMNDSGGNASSSSSSGSVSVSNTGGNATFKGDVSVWNDIESTIRQLLSSKGKVVVSQSSTSVTVNDKPSNVDLVGQYIHNLNSSLSQQVYMKIEILDVDLTNDYTLGIDWSILQRGLDSSKFVLNGSYGTPITITPFGGSVLPNFGLKPSSNDATSNLLAAVISSLNQQGRVSIVSQPRMVCMNNQVSVIKIVNSEQYIQSVQNTSSSSSSTSGSSSVTSQITPGTVVTGLTLYVLPKIMGDKVYLQLKIDLSQKKDIVSLCAQSDGQGGCASSSSVIQSPRIMEKVFNQRSILVSGETLVLSGFKQIQNNTGSMQLFNIQELGGKGAKQSSNDTVILVTPYVLHSGLTHSDGTS